MRKFPAAMTCVVRVAKFLSRLPGHPELIGMNVHAWLMNLAATARLDGIFVVIVADLDEPSAPLKVNAIMILNTRA